MIDDLARDLPGGTKKIFSILQVNEIPFQLRRFDEPAHHASQAAHLLGCELGAVVKSLVFNPVEQDGIVLVLVSGKNRVRLDRLQKVLGVGVTPTDPAVVLQKTGYPVGAVPPFGFTTDFPVIIDEDLMEYPFLWASAGTVQALMGLESDVLPLITQGCVCAIH